MSIYINGKLVAGGSQALPLLSFMWSDHQLNHLSWLRADTFSWQSGDVYVAAYNHLAGDIGGKTLQSETIDGTTIQFYLADDGHKICPASEESNVSAIYNSTGVAWYYILDTTNRQFKLPRTKWGFTGIRSGVGKYIPESLPNITGQISSDRFGVYNSRSSSGVFSVTDGGTYGAASNTAEHRMKVSFSAHKSNTTYQDGAPVQERATEMYLYFYVGNFTQTALENTAGLNAEMFNDLNAHKVIEFQTPTASNGYTWYRKYADGWVEQGGFASNLAWNGTGAIKTITLPIVMSDSNYTVSATMGKNNTSWNYPGCRGYADSTTQITVGVATLGNNQGTVEKVYWQVSGYAAQ